MSWALELMPVILATQEAEIKRILIRSLTGQIVHETISPKHPSQKRAGGMTQGVDPEFKTPGLPKKKKKKKQKTFVQRFGIWEFILHVAYGWANGTMSPM
jgi:hypothetical protein